MLNKRSFLAVLFLLVLTACSSERNRQYFGTDITGIDFARGFSLTSHEGKLVRSEDFKGKLVVLFFGFTYCPEVCPTTLSEFAVALEKMGEEKASEIQVLFVTIDPQRDDKNRLKNYVTAFNANFLGLTGTDDEIRKTADEYKIVFEKVKISEQGDNYTMDHTAGTYISDKQGRPRLYMSYGQDHQKVLHDLELLLGRE